MQSIRTLLSAAVICAGLSPGCRDVDAIVLENAFYSCLDADETIEHARLSGVPDACRREIYSAEFDGPPPEEWGGRNTSRFAYGTLDGRYVLRVNSDVSLYRPVRLSELEATADYDLEYRYRGSFPEERSGVGVLFGGREGISFVHEILISGNGEVSYQRLEDRNVVSVDSAIASSPSFADGREHTLVLRRVAARTLVFIDGDLIYERDDLEFRGHEVGVHATTAGTIRLDRFAAYGLLGS